MVGANPIHERSFLPSLRLHDIVALDDDYIPETTHLAMLEQPEAVAALTIRFLETPGLAGSGKYRRAFIR